jgi:hypothetical protein
MRANLAVLLPLLLACGSPTTPAQSPPVADPPAASATTEPTASAPPPDATASAPPVASAPPSAFVDLPDTPPATVSVSGTIDGTVFTAKDAVAMVAIDKGQEFSGSTVGVMLTDFGGACGLARKNANIAGTAIKVFVTTAGKGPNTPPIAAGSYKLHSDKSLLGSHIIVELETDDAGGKATVKKKATSGTITFTAIDAGHVAGKVNASFAHGSLKGTFDVPICTGVK